MINRQKIALVFLAIFFALIFFRLGIWQLDRARLMQEIAKPQAERPTISLTSVAQPNQSLETDALNRIVTLRGKYIGHAIAPNQEDSEGRTGTWLVGIFQVDGSGKIVIVRGIADRIPAVTDTEVEVVGRLVPSQINNKFGEVKPETLSRVDSALLLSEYGSDFFDGFVLARSENPESGVVKVPSPIPQVKVAGFYWQHISYVVIWWLFALLALAAPFIRSKR